jgi:hypothetical protein
MKFIFFIGVLGALYYFLGIPFVTPPLSRSISSCTGDTKQYRSHLTGEIKNFETCKLPVGWGYLEKDVELIPGF